jgi:hypothetical protein
MAKTKSGVYRCPSCGELSQIRFDREGKGECPECGFSFQRTIKASPRAGGGGRIPKKGKFVQRDIASRNRQAMLESIATPVIPAAPASPGPTGAGESPGEGRRSDVDPAPAADADRSKVRRRRRKRRRSRFTPAAFLAGWVVVTVLAVAIVKAMLGQEDEESPPAANQLERQKVESAEIADYLRKQMPECSSVLNRYLAAMDPAGRAQAVLDPIRVTPLMIDYYRRHPPLRPEGKMMPLVQNLCVVGEHRIIETVWRDSAERDMEVVFVRENGQWRIDWESQVRYGSAEWQLFLKGNPPAGEFRLYMRRIQTAVGESSIALKFYPPDYDQRVRRRGESPTVLVPAGSDLAKRVLAAFSGGDRDPELGDSVLAQFDPEGLARVRVRLAWNTSSSAQLFR